MNDVRYEVRGFTREGALDFHTWNIGEYSRDMEISAAKSRSEIARVEWKAPGVDWRRVK